MAPTVQGLHQRYGDTINFVMLNIDDPQWVAQIEQYDVTGIPQITVLDENQARVKTWSGRVPESILSEVLTQSLA